MTSLREVLSYEKRKYFKNTSVYFKNWIFNSDDYAIWKYQKALRTSEYFKKLSKKYKLFVILFVICRRKKNIIGRKLGFDIHEGCFDVGLRIYHVAPVVVNSAAHIGRDCIIVGNVCIGNVKGQQVAPHIGDNCMFGWGSTVIGPIEIADNCSIGAGAVVTKSVTEVGAVMLGIPGRNVKKDDGNCK